MDGRVLDTAWRLLDRLEGPAIESVAPAERWRARIAVRTSLGLPPWGLVFAVLFTVMGLPLIGVSIAISVVAVASARFLIPRVGLKVAGSVMTAGLVQALLVPAWYTNGVAAGCIPWVAFCIVLAFVVSGMRAGLVWSVVAMGAVWAGFGLQVAGWVPELAVTPLQYLFLTAMSHAGLFSIVAVMMSLSIHAVETQRIELEEARAEADRANLAKSSFLARMSHELRTPMNAMLGYAEMLREEADAELDDDLKRIESSGRQLLDLVNDILDLSKVEAEEMEFHLTTLQASDALVEATDQIRPLVDAGGNTLVIRSTPAPCRADPRRLRQCLLNLLSNANKFTHKGTITATVAAEGEQVVFEIVDSGQGMTPEQAAQVFDPFVQVHASGIQGTGLGLAIVKQFVERMAGEVDVQSTPGEGSRFRIILPAA